MLSASRSSCQDLKGHYNRTSHEFDSFKIRWSIFPVTVFKEKEGSNINAAKLANENTGKMAGKFGKDLYSAATPL